MGGPPTVARFPARRSATRARDNLQWILRGVCGKERGAPGVSSRRGAAVLPGPDAAATAAVPGASPAYTFEVPSPAPSSQRCPQIRMNLGCISLEGMVLRCSLQMLECFRDLAIYW